MSAKWTGDGLPSPVVGVSADMEPGEIVINTCLSSFLILETTPDIVERLTVVMELVAAARPPLRCFRR